MKKNITLKKNKNGIIEVEQDEMKLNALTINESDYCSDDPVYLQLDMNWEQDGVDKGKTLFVRRNSDFSIYVEEQFVEDNPDTNLSRHDFHLILPRSVQDMYVSLLLEEGEKDNRDNCRVYVHYVDEWGNWQHATTLPAFDVFKGARVEESEPSIGNLTGAGEELNSSIIIDLFTDNQNAEGVENWLYYNRQPYTDKTL